MKTKATYRLMFPRLKQIPLKIYPFMIFMQDSLCSMFTSCTLELVELKIAITLTGVLMQCTLSPC